MVVAALHAALSYRPDVVAEVLKIIGKQDIDTMGRHMNTIFLIVVASIAQYNKQVRHAGLAVGVYSAAVL